MSNILSFLILIFQIDKLLAILRGMMSIVISYILSSEPSNVVRIDELYNYSRLI